MSNADQDVRTQGPGGADGAARPAAASPAEDGPDAGGPATPGRGGRARRWWLTGLVALAVLLAFGAGLLLAGRGASGDEEAASQEPDQRAATPSAWLSGASGNDVASGAFGEWRGSPVEIAAAFADDNERMVELASLQPGEEYGDWEGDLDVAVGAIGEDESWADAADGEYDDRWRESLEGLADAWEGHDGTLYVRFAHEMNGDWYDWSVDEDSADDFVEAWGRYRALQQEVLPEAQLVFCTNKSSSDDDFDWREAFPGADQVDVLSVDYYNQSPYVGTDEEWQESLDEVGEFGDPIGLEAHREFAEEQGLPLAVSEWNNNADEGDSAAYVEGMHAFFEEHAGTGSGDLLYESVFNRTKEENRWLLFGEGVRMPDAAEAYQELF